MKAEYACDRIGATLVALSLSMVVDPDTETVTGLRVKPRPGGRSAQVRKRVLRAALEVVLEEGLGAFSVPAVAAKAGVHKTSLYRRWGDASALLRDALLARVGDAVPVPDSGSLRGDLRVLLGEVAAFLESPGGGALVRATVVTTDPEGSSGRSEYWKARFAASQELFARAVERGELPADTDAAHTLEMLVGPLYLRLLITGEPLTDSFLEQVIETVLHGVGAKP